MKQPFEAKSGEVVLEMNRSRISMIKIGEQRIYVAKFTLPDLAAVIAEAIKQIEKEK